MIPPRILCRFVPAMTASLLMQAQTLVDLGRQGKNIDFSQSSYTLPLKTGTTLPATCQVGEMYFKTDAAPGANVFLCTSSDTWTEVNGVDELPGLSGKVNNLLTNDGANAVWRSLEAGGSGALEINHTGDEITVDIVPAVVPTKVSPNTFSELNTFNLGFVLPARSTPVTPAEGQMWYDTTANRFRCREAGMTKNCIAGTTALPDPTGNTNEFLSNDGISALWRNFVAGGSGALQVNHVENDVSIDIVTGILPEKASANVFTGLNTFDLGVILSPRSTPGSPTNGQIWYDVGESRLKCREGGATKDCIPDSDPDAVTAPSNLGTNLPLLGNNNDRTVKTGTRSGSTTEFVTSSGSKTGGNCAQWDADGNLVDAGEECGGVSFSHAKHFYTNLELGSGAVSTGGDDDVTVFELVRLPFAMTFSQASLFVTTASPATTVEVAVYAADTSTGACSGTPIISASIDTSAAGVQSSTFLEAELEAGYYYLASYVPASVELVGIGESAWQATDNAGSMWRFGESTSTPPWADCSTMAPQASTTAQYKLTLSN